jgi:hypothetical protein
VTRLAVTYTIRQNGTVAALICADSVGRYFNARIKGTGSRPVRLQDA